MKKKALIVVILVLALAALFVAGKVGVVQHDNERDDEDVACTADAKICPDGTAVGRVAPDCEFALCPTEEEDKEDGNPGILPYDSGIFGHVLVGPQCPVVREDEPCPDKPYQTTVDIFRGGSLYASIVTDKNGAFEVSMPPGSYTLRPRGGEVFPSCSEAEVIVGSSRMEVTLSCDTGIR